MNEAQLSALFRPILAERELELEGLDITPIGKRKLVRVTVDGDGPAGKGPLLDDITAASKAISRAMDEADFVGALPYTLEVSSRGVSKPLTAPKHFQRNAGRLVKLWLYGDKADVIGRIVAAEEDRVLLKVEEEPISFAYADLRKAVVQVEMNAPVTEPEQES